MTASHSFTHNVGAVTTTDPNQAAFLLAHGHEIRAVEGDRWRCFVFDRAAAADAERYHDDAPVPARRFARAMRDIRTLLHRR